ncbi:hypothetical protein [Polymorphobacter multimanifer]|uniref:FkbM family methyltransferase n=1 Tax=Polymorphobacter multimanifer TaxID=1070431 RepID=A0A841LDJ9_9SPHN|nr:hypothetical protein [Polymorphobacter multimanifer]MBB6227885.1 hypothetical protein [Polymorphobacter multimanifer]
MSVSQKIARFRAIARDEGSDEAWAAMRFWLRMQLGLRVHDPVEDRRVVLARRIERIFGSTVAHGPFAGLKLAGDSWWGGADRAAMLLGLYEQDLLHALIAVPDRYRLFVDLGAADGYYGIGMLLNGRFDTSWCFEINPKGREVIARNAALNGVAERVVIEGEALPDFHTRLSDAERAQTVLLVDIEGGEFGLLTADVFRAFSGAMIFIEVHDWAVKDGARKLAGLRADAAQTHDIKVIRTGARDLSGFAELQGWTDTDRWLLCSEGRPELMQWLQLTPRTGA